LSSYKSKTGPIPQRGKTVASSASYAGDYNPRVPGLRILGRLQTVELLAMIAALALGLVPLSATGVESWYSTGFYPLLQRSLTPVSNAVSFAFLDVFLVMLAIAVVVSVTRAVRRAWHTRTFSLLAHTAGHLLAAAAAVYILFLVAWGLNYRRVHMPDRLVLDRAAPSSDQVVQLGLVAVGQMNSLYAAAHLQTAVVVPAWKQPALRSAFAEVQLALSDAPPAEPGRLKRSLLGPYFRWTGVDGMVNPFGLEVIVNPDLLPFERPFVAAHEWGHLAGYADEAEANFIGWLTCIRASAADQYSGWFYLYWQISGEVNGQERARLNAVLADGPRRDINAVIARLRGGEIPALQQASWKVYDKYLKANRVEAGVRSYGEVVTLLLRARFAPGWTPVRRGAS
jgi:hypothetical protein